MKRTNLVLDEPLLREAQKVLETRTYSATVNLALAEAVRYRRIQSLPQYFGKVTWEGDLAEMREDKPRRRNRAKTASQAHG